MYCGHETMIGRKITALKSLSSEIIKGKAYTVIDEYRSPDDKYDLKRVTVKSETGANFDLVEGEFS